MKKKMVIFGAGNLGNVLAEELSQEYEIVGFLDNNPALLGKIVSGYRVLGGTSKLKDLEYDELVIASTMRYDEIRKSLLDEGVPGDKFNLKIQNRLLVEVQARVNFLRDFAKVRGTIDNSVAVAEGGVFQGMFAKEINTHFADRKLYLFDTFSGFDARDVNVEINNDFSEVREGYYFETSEEIVRGKMPHPERVVIKKGYFPETLSGLEDEKFLFVNLDFDLYSPTLEGLRFFYPRMVGGGVILVHDYFTEFYHGVKKAIDDFEKEIGINLKRLPIGDGISVAISKTGGNNEDKKKVYSMRDATFG